ncbi:hypothetical protein Cni_G04801 [Canna indica]|uniref:J domain-containing protein n=1 Tax=Canna indica TaxID=4628 RepID=A0AAQ3JTM2_9LILI|nr:hypothetical protein Cni_G04801 [Canna indica]
MDASGANSGGSCYYSLLGIRRNASASDIRAAYRRLALKWHPDRWAKEPTTASGEAKRRFQRIQEAYSVLSDKGKRAMYDAGLYDPLDDDDQDFSDFMQEMLTIMDGIKSEKPDTLEDLQRMLAEIVDGDQGSSGGAGRRGPSDTAKRGYSVAVLVFIMNCASTVTGKTTQLVWVGRFCGTDLVNSGSAVVKMKPPCAVHSVVQFRKSQLVRESVAVERRICGCGKWKELCAGK